MHPVLLIDEIVQLIFESVLEDGKSSLCSTARCCQAWKDPALDRIWRRLPSATPLLSLLPGYSEDKCVIWLAPLTPDTDLTVFRLYAIRVRHIAHCHRVLGDLTNVLPQLSYLLGNLETSRIERNAIGPVALQMSQSSRLRVLTLHTSYTKTDSTSTAIHDTLSCFEGIFSLEQLSIRGHSSKCLQRPLSTLTALRSLSLHLSCLTEGTFMAVSALPLLADFDVHADRLSYDSLSTAISHACGTRLFAALEKLKIRARPSLVELVIQHLPPHKLSSLHVDVVGPNPPSALETLFKIMSASRIRDFTLEHSMTSDETRDISTYASDNFFTIEHFRHLSGLPLRCFVLDSSLPPDFSDLDFEEMSKWWPLLERLDLGSPTALENTEASWKPRLSLASLSTLARGCKHLKSLVVTLDAKSVPSGSPPPVHLHPLSSLSISSRSRPDVSSVSVMLSDLFPSLAEVTTGFVGAHEDAWATIQTTILNRSEKPRMFS